MNRGPSSTLRDELAGVIRHAQMVARYNAESLVSEKESVSVVFGRVDGMSIALGFLNILVAYPSC